MDEQDVRDPETAANPTVQRLALVLGPTLGLALTAWLWNGPEQSALAITSGLLLWVAIWWLTEPVPAAFTSMLPLAALPAAGVLTPAQVAESVGNELILLLMGGFMLAAALEANGAHRRMALWMVHLFGGRNGRRLLFGFGFATAAISMWISNTAATLMMLPVAMAICASYPDTRLRVPLILTIAYAASIGGWGTPIGTPPNLVFMQVYQETTGTQFDFFEWMRIGIPIILIMVPLMCLWLGRHLGDSPKASLPPLGAWSPGERRVLALFGLVILLWVFRTTPYGGWTGRVGLKVNDASIAIFGVILMGLVSNGRGQRLLTWQAAERIPWGALLLFAGGIALATAFEKSGLGAALANQLTALKVLPTWALILGVVAGITLLSEIASNTATAVLLMPILAATAKATGIDPAVLMFPAVLAASCGFMLPVATAPNLVAYGSGHVPLKRMIREGSVLDGIGVIVLSVICWLVFR
ncbi:sodium:dicarboxylate symporter [Ahniella affigens]|uniref:Sodium:dicarboxylate symporter n=1 Tax=Ahniella affigens TaxID=2021234 RepID=A0A2P1PUS0_9GAMM|nr:SLC13 family permease [Ahniella affigens]AVP98584.1 sodium:dicarboxylate symporter [Ahniella affigens]